MRLCARPGPAPRRARALAAALALLAAAPAPARGAAPEEPRALWLENRRLVAEVELAKGPTSYFVLDLSARRLALRVRGMDLAGWPIREALVWGGRLRAGASALEAKDALPRPAIVPGEEKGLAQLDAQILEVQDMPAAYRVGLAGNVEVQVLPAAGPGARAWLRHRIAVLRWRLARPLQTLEDRRRRRERTSLLLVLDPDDARAVYWSLYEGIAGIVVPP